MQIHDDGDHSRMLHADRATRIHASLGNGGAPQSGTRSLPGDATDLSRVGPGLRAHARTHARKVCLVAETCCSRFGRGVRMSDGSTLSG